MKLKTIKLVITAGLSLGLVGLPMATPKAAAAPPTASISVSTLPVYDNGTVNVAVDFPTSTYDGVLYGNYPRLVLEKSTDSGATWQKVGTCQKSTSAGVYTFSYNVGTETQKIRVSNDPSATCLSGQTGAFYNDPTKVLSTAEVAIDPQTPPPPGTNTLTIQADGKKATATFATPHGGQSASLQIETILTKNTREVTAPAWKTIATASQNSSGVATFSISNPYEVSHVYRVISGADVSDVVTFAAPEGAKTTGIPQVYMNTNEQATVDTRTRYFEGTFTMTAGNGCTAVATIPKSVVKGRGNYSWSFAKKSFTVKLDKSTDLCGLGKSKKWALVANHYDKSLLRNTVAGWVGSKFSNLAWTPKSTPVDLWMNGSYRGSYILIERIAIDTLRVNIPKVDDYRTVTDPATLGYIMEWDFRKGADHNITARSNGWLGIKEPEDDKDEAGVNTGKGITAGQITFIDGKLDAADSALFGSGFTGSTGWRSHIDEASAVDYYLAMEFMKPIDGNMWASVFMYWDPTIKKFKFGPMWDFDMSSGSAVRAGDAVNPRSWYLRNPLGISAMQSPKTWFNRLNEDSAFRSAVRTRWNQVSSSMSGIGTFVDSQKAAVKLSAAENWKVWSITQHLSSSQVVKGNWDADVSYLRSWLTSRKSYFDSQF